MKKNSSLGGGVFARVLVCAAVCWLFNGSEVFGGGGPENYLLVVNSSSASSQTIANHYIALRKIPSSNVLYLKWTGDMNTTDVETFRKQILQPILQTIEDRGLTAHIDGVIYSSDFPYNIDFKNDVPAQEAAKLEQAKTPIGSINGLTYYYQWVLAKQPVFLNYNLTTNAYFRPIVKGKQAAETRGFSGWYGWGQNGDLLESGGSRYLLSTILGLTTGKGITVDEVVKYLRRSEKADGSAPAGTIYFAKTDDVRTQTRLQWFEPAVGELKKLGVNAEVIDTLMPLSKKDVAGAMLGQARFAWSQSGSTILPGAIVENLTSYGAEMPNVNNHTLLTELLAAGAAGSSGTAVEPLSIPHKFPLPFLHVHYARGCTLAEAFYQSVAAPYQLVIVGDPLCRPWAKIPTIDVQGLAADDTLKGKVTFTPTGRGGAAEVDRFDLYMDGEYVGGCGKGGRLELDTTKKSDGFHELRVVGIESGPIETQGRVIVPVTFNNHGRTMKLSSSVGRARSGQKIKLTAEAPGAKVIVFYSNGRSPRDWRVNGASGSFTLDTAGLGTGPVTIRAMGQGANPDASSHVIAAPVTVEIEPAR